MFNPVTALHFIYLLFYLVIAGQAIFYHLCFASVFSRISPAEFLKIRNLAEPMLDLPLRIVYPGGLFLGILFTIASFFQTSLLYRSGAIAVLLLFVTDLLLAKTRSMPLNDRIRQAGNATHTDATWLQSEWIRWIRIRGTIALFGFGVLLMLSFIR